MSVSDKSARSDGAFERSDFNFDHRMTAMSALQANNCGRATATLPRRGRRPARTDSSATEPDRTTSAAAGSIHEGACDLA